MQKQNSLLKMKHIKFTKIEMNNPIPTRMPDLVVIELCYLLNFAVPVDPRVKMKESKKMEKYLDFVREQQ